MEKATDYYGSDRSDLLALVPADARTVLDVGCGAAETWRARRAARGLEVWGVEIVPEAAARARANVDRLIELDAESIGPDVLPDRHFDTAFLADVLEHMRDPWRFLAELPRVLRGPDASVVVSLPNVRHYRVLKRLVLRGRFRYQDSGILDRTHLRFFCRRDAELMLADAGFEIVELRRRRSSSRVVALVNRLCFGAFDDFLTEQYLIRARLRR